MKNTIFITSSIVLVIAGFVWLAGPKKSENQTAILVRGTQSSEQTGGELTAEETFHDFGNISMKNGKVSYSFKVKNAGLETAIVRKLYTSCMCTEANLVKSDGKKTGPFGMAGHGFIPNINKKMMVGEEFEVEAIFDPNAHGPAGVGPIDRIIYVENDGELLELRIAGVVTP